MNKEQLRNELDTTLTGLHDLFAALPAVAVNTLPFEGSWTPGQLVRHLVLVNGGFLDLINGPVQEAIRPADAGVEKLRAVLLDHSAKREAPGMVVPPAIQYGRERLLTSFRQIHTGLLAAIDTLDLTLLCTAFEVPALGHPTRWEALHFVLYHTQRHLQQLRGMMDVMKGKKGSGVESLKG